MFPDASSLPLHLRSLIESELKQDERILWFGQPLSRRMARSSIGAVLFGIPWTAFLIFWTVGAAEETQGRLGFLLPIFGIPGIVIGLGLLTSPFWVMRGAKRSAYVLTNRRAIVFRTSPWGEKTVRSFEPAQLNDLCRQQFPDGSGDLIFTIDLKDDTEGGFTRTRIGFLAVPNVKEVEEMVRALAAAADR